jgi:uncharacterized membrane protein
MNSYSEAVTKIADDYLERVKSQLRQIPNREQDEFLKEIQSHIYEAYQQTPGEDEVGRILAVLRKFGEPAEVVADRLPGTMMRAGAKRNLPLYILGGILIALFGLPLGFGGIGVLIGLLGGLAGIVAAYYVTAGTFLLVGTVFVLSGLARIFQPVLWDKLIMLGFIQMDGPVGDLLDQLSPAGQGIVMIAFAMVFLAAGVGMLWVGRYLLRGLRFLFGLVCDWTRRLTQSIRRRMGQGSRPYTNKVSFGFGLK